MEQTGEPLEQAGGEPTLQRSISLWQMTLYGAGGMLGAGIYGLIGQVAAEMGSAIWLAFALSLVAAGLTGLSYASLGSRYPRAGGAAYITQRAWRRSLLTHMVGLTVACSGLTSIAAGARVVGENLQALAVFESLPTGTLAFIYLAIVGAIVYRGIRESMWANVAMTLMEAGGLLLVIAVSLRFWGSANLMEFPVGPETESGLPLVLLAQGIVLTFYAFIGFEDSLNVAEELKNPRRNLPLGLVGALLLTVVIYMSVAISAVSVVPWQELAEANAPLAEVVARAAPWFPAWVFIVITVFAVANTGLINYITTSRLLYGMSRDGHLPPVLSKVHPERRTPHVAIGLIFALIVILILSGDISELASATVLLLLLVFLVVNSALVVLKLRPDEPPGGFELPIAVPALGAVVCVVMFATRVGAGDWRAPAIAGVLLLGVAALYFVLRRRRVADGG
ncbi:MAG: amino acid permease [Rhodospirillaceae bacterium]|nr:amino acid permease [Rhodospirillaceae bacterium]